MVEHGYSLLKLLLVPLIALTATLSNAILNAMNKKQLILFDGVCLFCNGAVNFIIKRDHQKQFVFAPIQSSLGQSLMAKYDLVDKPDTFALIADGSCMVMIDAVIAVVKQFGGLWRCVSVFSVLPRALRDYAYRLFGRYRYRLFGKSDACMIPTSDAKPRFIGDSDDSQW